MLRAFTAMALLLLTGTFADSDPSQELALSRSRIVFEGQAREAGAVAKRLGFIQASSSNRSAACCKICSTGKACGDTCISRNDVCRVGPGCACNG